MLTGKLNSVHYSTYSEQKSTEQYTEVSLLIEEMIGMKNDIQGLVEANKSSRGGRELVKTSAMEWPLHSYVSWHL